MTHILAHRGLSNYPENSRIALQKALEKGFGVETDVHRTKDGHIVVVHDKNMKRLYGLDADITALGIKEVKRISSKKNRPIMELSEFLGMFMEHSKKRAVAAIQIKDCNEKGIISLASKAIADFDRKHPEFETYSRIFLFDLTRKAAKEMKKINPRIKVGISVGEGRLFARRDYRKQYPTIYTPDELGDFGNFDIIWGDEWHSGLYTREFLQKFRGMGKKVFAISPELHKETEPKHPDSGNLANIKKTWKNLIGWGVDGICTDHPEKLAEVLKHEKN